MPLGHSRRVERDKGQGEWNNQGTAYPGTANVVADDDSSRRQRIAATSIDFATPAGAWRRGSNGLVRRHSSPEQGMVEELCSNQRS
jgi:hypothetical protein